MKERPILMSAPMVRAILEGRKTQTRRVVKPQTMFDGKDAILRQFPNQSGCPYGQPGDRLWVRETWQDYCPTWNGAWCGCGSKEMQAEKHRPVYRAAPDERGEPKQWKPSIFMPRWASRITLEITGVRVERLQEISGADAIAEGIEQTENPVWSSVDEYQHLWDQINAKRAPWASNPWVWVIEFKRLP